MASDQDSWISSALGVDVGSIVSKVESAASSATDTVSSVATTALDDVASAATSANGMATAVASSVANEVKSTVDDTVKTVTGTVSDVRTHVEDTIDTGIKGVSSAVSTAVDDAKAAGSVAKDAASQAWKGAKVVGGAIEDEAKAKYQEMKQDAELVKQGEGYAGKGIDWLENEAKSGTKWAADEAKGIPVAEQLAKGIETTVDQDIDFVGGVDKAVVGMVGGVLGAAADPVDTAKALYTMSEHIPVVGLPEKVLGEAYDVATSDKTLSQAAKEVADPADDAKYWGNVGKGLWQPIQKSIDDGKPMEGVGQAAAQIGSLFIGAGEVGMAGKVADVAEVAGTAGKVADLADAADIAKAADAAKLADGADIAKAADAAKLADGADIAKATDASKGAEAADAADAATNADQVRVRVPENPNVNPYGKTQLPPTELPTGGDLVNPKIPKPPKLPEFTPEELGEQGPPTQIDPEPPAPEEPALEEPDPVTERNPKKPEHAADDEPGPDTDREPEKEFGTEEGGDKPPEDDYDVEGWKKYYEKHPEMKRSAGAAAADDPKMAEGAGEAGTEDGEAAADSPEEETEEPAAGPKTYTREDAARLIDESEGQVIDSSKPGAKGHAETHTGSREDEALDLLNRRGKTTMYRSRVQAEKDLRDFLNRHSEELDKLPPGGKLELSEPVNQPRNVYEAKPWEPNPDAATVVTKTVKQKLFVKIIKTDDGLHLRTMYLQE